MSVYENESEEAGDSRVSSINIGNDPEPGDFIDESADRNFKAKRDFFEKLGNSGKSTETRRQESRRETSTTVLAEGPTQCTTSADIESSSQTKQDRPSSSSSDEESNGAKRSSQTKQDRQSSSSSDEEANGANSSSQTKQDRPSSSSSDEESKGAKSAFYDMEVFKQPMCLVSTEEGNKLKLEERTVNQLKVICWPMIIVAVVGLYRTGKSYLMNQLAGSKKGFALGNTIQSMTKGIWVWCVIHPKKQNTVLLLLDTEGLGDVEKGDSNHDNRIFALATLLCNCLVYNMKDVFNQDAVSKLTFITEMTKNIRFRKTSSPENEYLSLILPEFILCVRDFFLKLVKEGKAITSDEYLEESLKEQKGKDDSFNKPRECIRKYFPVRKCFIFPPPGDIEVLEKLDTLSFDDLPERFKEATGRFVSYIYTLKPKELLVSKPVNGLMFTTLATNYVTAIRNGAIPDVDDAFLATAKIENSRIQDIALKMFEDSMAEVALPVPSRQLEDRYTTAQRKALGYLRSNVIHDTNGRFELKTQSAMDNIWNKLQRENADKILDLSQEKLNDAFKNLKENIIKKVYKVAGGHKKFQRDLSRMKDEFMSSLRDFKGQEISWTWLGFLETLKTTESEIIEADDHLSGQEKEETVLTKNTSLAPPSAETERSSVTFNEECRTRVDEVPKRQTRASSPGKYNSPRAKQKEHNQERRYDVDFDKKLRARIEEASRREESAFSPNDMEVFKQPMCLISAEEGNTLKIEERTVEQINAIWWPMIIVAVVGIYRTGKSYLMNRLAGTTKGFALGDTIQSMTKGIWVWCVIHPEKENTVLLLIDTEGLGDVEKGDSNHDNKIFSLATLLCNCLVYNIKGAFDQDAVSKLTFITEMTKNIRFSKSSSQGNECMALILPEFVLCVRDFSLKLIKDKKKITSDEYLEGSLQEQKEKDDSFNKPRECIKKYFPMRKCFTFPVPGDADVLEKLDDLSFDDLSDRFKEATVQFVSYVHSLKPKALLASKPVNGLMFTTLATNYVTAIRHGAIPDVDDAFLATTKIENSRIKDKGLKIFEKTMADVKLPVPSTRLDDIYTRAQRETLKYLRTNVVHDPDGNCELTTQSEMDKIWYELKKKNSEKILDLSAETLEDAFKSLKGNIDKKIYEVAGGHKTFQRDVNRMKDEFMSSLGDFRKEQEISGKWLDFIESLKATESKIIEADEQLSEKEKEEERKQIEDKMRELTEEHEKKTKEALEKQHKLLEEHHKKMDEERNKESEEERKKYEEFINLKLEKENAEKELERLKKEQNEKKNKWIVGRIWDAVWNK